MSHTADADTRPLCIIPARGGSRRFPRKNAAPFAGRPLVGVAVAVAKASGVFRTVCVSSDDDEILAIAEDYGADIALRRSGEVSAYEKQVKDVCQAALTELALRGASYAAFGVLLPTSPLRTADDIRASYQTLCDSGLDCCMTLTPCAHPPQRALHIVGGRVEPHFGHQYLLQTQALEPLYRHDGTAIFARTEAFLREQTFYGLHIAPYLIPAERAVDVDSPLDLAWAEFLVTHGPSR